MLEIIAKSRVSCFAVACMVLLALSGRILDLRLDAASEPSPDEVAAFVANATGPANVNEQIGTSWSKLVNIQRFVYFRLERFGIVGDIIVLSIGFLALSTLGIIGAQYGRSERLTVPIQRLLTGMYWLHLGAIGTCVVVCLLHTFSTVRTDPFGLSGIAVPWSLASDLKLLFDRPFSTQPGFVLGLTLMAPFIQKVVKLIEDEEATV